MSLGQTLQRGHWNGSSLAQEDAAQLHYGFWAGAALVLEVGVYRRAYWDDVAEAIVMEQVWPVFVVAPSISGPAAVDDGDPVSIAITDLSRTETHWEVHISTSPGFTPSPGTLVATLVSNDMDGTGGTQVHVEPNLAVGTHYVKAVGRAGEAVSSPSNQLAVVVEVPAILINAPALFVTPSAVTKGDLISISITDASTNEASWEIHRSQTPGFTPTPGTLIQTVASANPTGFNTNQDLPDQDSQPLAAGVWRYRVRGIPAPGISFVSTPSIEKSVTVSDPIPLIAPSITGPGSKESDEVIPVTITDNSIDETHWKIHRSGNAGFTPGPTSLIATIASTTSSPGTGGTQIYNDGPLAAGLYFYKVLASDGVSEGAESNDISVTVTQGEVIVEIPAPFITIRTTPITEGAIVWIDIDDNSTTETHWEIHRFTSAGFTPGPGTLLNTIPSSNPTTLALDGDSYPDENRPPGTYYYRVLGKAGSSISASSNEVAAVVNAAPDLRVAAPTIFVPSTKTDEEVIPVTITDNSDGETHFEIHRSTSISFTPGAGTLIATIATANGPGTGGQQVYNDGPLAEDTYHYKVRAKDATQVGPSSNEEAVIVTDGGIQG